jgi:hypothetical protein
MTEEKIQSGRTMMLKIIGVLVGFMVLCILLKYILGM